MKQPLKFHHALRAVIERASARHKQATGHALSLSTVARDVGIDPSTFAALLLGEIKPDTSYLLPLLVYLGCDEKEQRFVFHLAELAILDDSPSDPEPSTEEHAAKLFAPPNDTDPATDRITEERPRT